MGYRPPHTLPYGSETSTTPHALFSDGLETQLVNPGSATGQKYRSALF